VSKLLVYIALGFVLWTILSSNVQPPSSIDGKVPIPFAPNNLGGWKGPDDGEGLLTISNRAGDAVAQYTLGSDGVLHQDPKQAAEGLFKAEFRPDEYFGRWTYDFGAIAAYDGKPRLGVRFSPVRLFYDLAAPDIIATESAVGLGISLYPPKRSVGTWHHVGAGAWLTYDIATGSNAISLGLSSSTR